MEIGVVWIEFGRWDTLGGKVSLRMRIRTCNIFRLFYLSHLLMKLLDIRGVFIFNFFFFTTHSQRKLLTISLSCSSFSFLFHISFLVIQFSGINLCLNFTESCHLPFLNLLTSLIFQGSKRLNWQIHILEEWKAKRKKNPQTLLECVEVWFHRLPSFADFLWNTIFYFWQHQRAYSCQGFEVINYRDEELFTVIKNFFFWHKEKNMASRK